MAIDWNRVREPELDRLADMLEDNMDIRNKLSIIRTSL